MLHPASKLSVKSVYSVLVYIYSCLCVFEHKFNTKKIAEASKRKFISRISRLVSFGSPHPTSSLPPASNMRWMAWNQSTFAPHEMHYYSAIIILMCSSLLWCGMCVATCDLHRPIFIIVATEFFYNIIIIFVVCTQFFSFLLSLSLCHLLVPFLSCSTMH